MRPFLRGRLLDIGCGNGALAEYCKPVDYYGYDIDATTVSIGRNRYPGYRFEQVLPEGELFDTVVGLAIIEHLPNPAEDIRKWGSFLDRAGQIVLTTPHPALGWVHNLGARAGLFSNAAAEEHEELIDLKMMKDFAEKTGLVVGQYGRFLLGANQIFVLSRSQELNRAAV